MHALGKRPKGQQPWVRIERDDDTAFEGLLLGYSYNMDPASVGVDFAVRRPIYVTPPGRSPERRDLDRALVPGKRIRTVSVHLVPGDPGRRPSWPTRWATSPAASGDALYGVPSPPTPASAPAASAGRNRGAALPDRAVPPASTGARHAHRRRP